MPYTSQGLMTQADLNDFQLLTDTGRNPDCPGHEDGPESYWPGLVYCSAAENCPDEDLEPL